MWLFAAVLARYDFEMTEMPLPEGEHLAEVAREAAASGEVVYLTGRGQRLAAIAPARLAELLERRHSVSPAPPSNSTLSGTTTAARPSIRSSFAMCCTKLSCLLLVVTHKSLRS